MSSWVLWSAAVSAQEAAPRKVELRTLWKFAEPDADIDHVAAFAGMVYVAFGRGSLVALRADDGSEAWRRKIGTERIYGIGRVGDDKVEAIVMACGDQLGVLDRLNGEPRWLATMPTELAQPVVVGKAIVAGGADGQVHARSLETGEPLWTADVMADAPADPPGFDGKEARIGDQKARPGPAARDGDLVVVPLFDQCRAVAVDASSGKRTVTFPAQGWMYMQPVFAGQFVLVGGQDNFFRCFDKSTGAEVWTYRTGFRVEAACTVADDRVYWGSCDGKLYCLGLAGGDLIWKQSLAGDAPTAPPIYERPSIVGDMILMPLLSGEVLALDRATGKVLARHRPAEGAEIDGAASAGALLFVQTRKNVKGRGEAAVFAVGR